MSVADLSTAVRLGLLVGLVVGLLAGVVTGLVAGPVLRRLPEPVAPADDPDLAAKPTYASLATPRTLVGLGAAAVAASVGVTTTQPLPSWPAWLVLSTLGVLLAMIDGRTTWLPRILTRAGWALGAAAALGGLLLGGTVADTGRTLAGGLAAGGFFALVHRLSRGGIAFGDVRLAPLVGLAAASTSWTMLFAAVLGGTVAAWLHGVGRQVRGRRGPFPYAPGLVTGALLSAPLARLLGLV